MSVARWCDYGDHAYKGGREGTVMMGVTKAGGNDQDVREMCPECAANLGLNEDYEVPESPAERHRTMLEAAGKSAKR